MTIKHRLIAILLAIYPVQWRREYRDELKYLLFTEPLGLGTIVDVVWSGARERLRSLEIGRAKSKSTGRLGLTGR